ncbi:hypothetical protein XELAEV_18005609mg [Xenopus laevis]|uniref:Uncharacterized protein n=1 Tax=Xenopus laevis TaxID=8355 RepID=A0A974I3I7_XENLA|nr:hypothetical protein XELAEV_18005609mg [Xenopus laevis]
MSSELNVKHIHFYTAYLGIFRKTYPAFHTSSFFLVEQYWIMYLLKNKAASFTKGCQNIWHPSELVLLKQISAKDLKIDR